MQTKSKVAAAAAVRAGRAKRDKDAIRITVEQDNVDDDDSASSGSDSRQEEEVEDIGSDASDGKQKNRKKPKSVTDRAGGPAGLANVLRALLQAKPAGACPILAKALTDRQRFKPAADGDDAEAGQPDSNADLGRKRRKLTAQHQRWLALGRCKPNPSAGGVGGEREAERQLERIACRGVVQLFNAVRAQQKTLEARLAGRSEAGRQRVLASLSRNDFLDMLAGRRKAEEDQKVGGDAAEDDEEDEAAQLKKKSKKSWGVLSEDYLVKPNLSLKDWDRDSSDEQEEAEPMDDD